MKVSALRRALCASPKPLRPRTIRATCHAMSSFYDLKASDIDGNVVGFEEFKGKVVLITNVASRCGYTSSNYKELVQLHDKYGKEGLEVVAFPCNQFGRQEPGSAEEIKSFARDKYGVDFRMMDKVDVNGPETSPVFDFLKGACANCAGDIRWNFAAKFIVDKSGQVVERNSGSPAACEGLIQELLSK